MNYDKLSRSLRYYYEKGIMQKVTRNTHFLFRAMRVALSSDFHVGLKGVTKSDPKPTDVTPRMIHH